MTLPSSTMSSECEICAICLDEYVQEDTIRVLRRCKHMFLKDCIDEWMRMRSLNCICPIFRGSMIKQSVEVPGTSCGFGAAIRNNTHPLMSITFANNTGRPSDL
ncbi:hypothetical protein LWI28_022535 [Acer negundo]|uniref:RING-type domain-containing protein n=1 Tax=Acer negundo TaxID=4023 RepID=A0AAD5IJB9_ACENE|nr:hypothetical protein LWI28_022535 [Acer negundo]